MPCLCFVIVVLILLQCCFSRPPRDPRDKMKVDVQEMIYWLQQERRQKAAQSAAMGHATLEFTKPS